jgi:ribonuclease Y
MVFAMGELGWGLVGGAIGLVIGGVIVYLVFFLLGKSKKAQADKIIRDANIKADMITKNAQIDAKQALLEQKNEAEKEFQQRRQELNDQGSKLSIREDNMDKRDLALIAKENALDEKDKNLSRQQTELDKKDKTLQEKIDSIVKELENVAHMTEQQAHDEIMLRIQGKMDHEIAQYMKDREEEAKDEADTKAENLLALAISKHAQEVAVEKSVTTVALPSDEMKGRIIGREGRNIKSLEQLLGVDILIDDTPEAITVSCFNPIRREVARKTLEALVNDGRIQPGRIEEIFNKMKAEVDDSIFKAGQEAVFKLGLGKVPKEEVELIGRLKYRTSYGQNGLEHSIEVAELAGVMASELGLDQMLARRAGLFHDIGKALDFEVDGSHVEIGVRVAKKYGESPVVVNAIESHHGDVEQKYVISILVQAADTLSAARPGARSETLEKYIKRIEQLEEITKQFDGVDQAYAIQSGRELRVMVVPDKVDDLQAFKMAQEIKDKIETTMTYPGQIRVTVIREYRAVETAK